MPDLAPFHRDFVFVHLLGVFMFLLAHGVSAGVLFRLRSERDPAVLRSLLRLSEGALSVMGVGALILLVAGILAGFSGNYWTTGRYWLWASLVIFIGVGLLMTPLARFPLNRVRDAVDEATGELDAATMEAAVGARRPILVASVGLGAVALLAWLMMYKPF